MFSVQIVVAIVVLIIVDNDWDKDYDNDVSRWTTTATRLRASRYAVARDYGLRKDAAQSSTERDWKKARKEDGNDTF